MYKPDMSNFQNTLHIHITHNELRHDHLIYKQNTYFRIICTCIHANFNSLYKNDFVITHNNINST